jgi:hypothetical protein
VVPPAVAAREIAEGTLRLVATGISPPRLSFTASCCTGPEDVLLQRLAVLAAGVTADEARLVALTAADPQ